MITNITKSNEFNLQLDFKQVIYALSDSLDFVGVDEIHHGKRVGIMAQECAKTMGMSEAQSKHVFEIGLLHDCGVSSTRVHQHLVSEFDWSSSQIHCDTGFELLNSVEFFRPMAMPIKYHHTHWQLLQDLDIDEKIKEYANIIYLADRVDVLGAAHYGKDILAAKEEIRRIVSEKSGEYFAPHINEAFWEASQKQAFWLSLTPEHIMHFMQNLSNERNSKLISPEELMEIALLFSKIVDTKSPFTMEHSFGVAKISRYLAEKLNLSKEVLYKIEIAGLLHDLGKLKIPDEILEKTDKLTENERGIIQIHSFETYEILSNITGLEDIARWAAYHHERADGKGYPFQINKDNLEIESKIIAASDVFQALVQNRPYRPALSIPEALVILNEMVIDGSLDSEIVKIISENSIECHELAFQR
ncbi:MAG: HD domain-containing protein [Spirochaetia bacterium]|nr:HD domain-containing protein [Spirochaetia bacterium]